VTGRPATGPPASLTAPPAGRPDPPHGDWRGAAPEIAVGAAAVAAIAAAGYAMAGPAGASVVVVCAAALSLVTLRAFLPPARPPASEDDLASSQARPLLRFTGYWRRRSGLLRSTRSAAVYQAELRGTLQSLLAARLAERHGISLQSDPAAARRLLCRGPADEDLWDWVDPAGRPATADQPGIPPRTLRRLIDRLEQL
jgi:hypothetical protein